MERLLHHMQTCSSILAEPAMVEDLAVAVGDGNAAVRAAARACVALLIEADRHAQADGSLGGA